MERQRPRLDSTVEQLPRQFAAAGLAHAEILLRAMGTLVQAGQARVSGVLVRVIWECWCVGLYLLFGGEAALQKVRRYYEYRLGQLVRDWPTDDREHPLEGLPIDRDARREEWNLFEIAEKVEETLRARQGGIVKHKSTSSYGILYRFESIWGSHAGYGTFNNYLDVRPDDPRIRIDPNRSSPLPADGGQAFAAIWVGELAYCVYEAFDLDLTDISALLRDLYVAANDAAPSE
jgi:hypothetical protein